LLLHGFPDSNYLWRGVIPELTQAGVDTALLGSFSVAQNIVLQIS